MFPVLNLGPLSLPAAPLILLIGFWLASSYAERKSQQSGKDPELLSRIIWYALLAGILGSRLSFIARNPSAFQGNWKSILSLNQALLDPIGGLLIALAVAYYLTTKNGKPLSALLDDLVPFFAVFAPAIYLANFASGTGIGMLTDLPWGIKLYGGSRHPVQIYFLISSLIVLYLLETRIKTKRENNGSRFLVFSIFTAGYLTFFHSFQDPLGNTLWGLRINQLFSWGFFTLSLYLYYKNDKKGVDHASS